MICEVRFWLFECFLFFNGCFTRGVHKYLSGKMFHRPRGSQNGGSTPGWRMNAKWGLLHIYVRCVFTVIRFCLTVTFNLPLLCFKSSFKHNFQHLAKRVTISKCLTTTDNTSRVPALQTILFQACNTFFWRKPLFWWYIGNWQLCIGEK